MGEIDLRVASLEDVAEPTTGALVPVEIVIRLAHRQGAKVLIDGCQAAPRLPVDVQALGCDFYAFSGHKTYGPTGFGVLYVRHELLSAMPHDPDYEVGYRKPPRHNRFVKGRSGNPPPGAKNLKTLLSTYSLVASSASPRCRLCARQFAGSAFCCVGEGWPDPV